MANLETTIQTSLKAALNAEITRANGLPGRRPADRGGLCVAQELAGQEVDEVQSRAEQQRDMAHPDRRSLTADMTVELAMHHIANALELRSPQDLSAPAEDSV